jgi:hypothetical protein
MSLELALDWSTESHRGNPMALVAQTLDTAAPLPADIRPSSACILASLFVDTI